VSAEKPQKTDERVLPARIESQTFKQLLVQTHKVFANWWIIAEQTDKIKIYDFVNVVVCFTIIAGSEYLLWTFILFLKCFKIIYFFLLFLISNRAAYV
jgi:hypothetical protein